MNLYKQLIFKLQIAMKLLVYFFFSKSRLMNDEAYNKLLFFIMFGRIPDFDNPKTFNEFICARKVRLDEYWLSEYTDKYAVRDYVAQCIGEKHLNEIYGVFGHLMRFLLRHCRISLSFVGRMDQDTM